MGDISDLLRALDITAPAGSADSRQTVEKNVFRFELQDAPDDWETVRMLQRQCKYLPLKHHISVPTCTVHVD